MAIEIGQRAPAFTLYSSDRTKVSLSDYQDKNVVLLFFPLAFSSVCTAELCSVRDNIDFYNGANAQVLGISIDSLFVLNKFKADQNLNFPLLSDFNKETAKAYEVLYETFPAFEMHGVSKRAVFVIDRTGAVKYAEICATPGDQPSFDAIRQTLSTLS
jgi:glutaredoxin-dependent peroxiredoxin